MGDLVFLRALIRTPESNRFPLSIDRVFPHIGMGELLECVIARAAPPRSPVAFALPLNVIGEKPINARARARKDVLVFSKRYARWMIALIHLDVAQEDSCLFGMPWVAHSPLRAKQARNSMPPKDCAIPHMSRDRCR